MKRSEENICGHLNKEYIEASPMFIKFHDVLEKLVIAKMLESTH